MSELKERLERLSELGTPAGADVIWKRVSHRLATPPEAPTEPDDHRRSRRVSSVVAISLALVVALVVAGVIVLMRTNSRSHPSVAAGQGPSSTQGALDSEHTQTLLASVDSQRGLEITDVDQATTQTLVPGPMSLGPCNTCPLVRRGNAVFFARDGRAYVLDAPHSAPRDLGPASFVFSGSDNTVWTATTSQNSGTVTRLDDRGNRTGGPWTIPDGYRISLNFLPKEIDGRILLLRGSLNPPHALYAWDPKNGKRVRLGDVLFTVDTYQQPGVSAGTLAWVPQDTCRRGLRQCALTISDLSSQDPAKNKTRTVDPPSDSNGFIGGGAFSPDGRTLAAFVEATPTHQGPAARLVLVDVASGAVRDVRGGQISIGESYGFATWDPTGRWLFFGGFPRPLLVHRNDTDDAVALNLPASYTSAALAAPPPSGLPAPTATTADGPPTTAQPTAPTLTHLEGTHGGTEHYALSKGRCSYLEHHLDSTFKLNNGNSWKYRADYCGTVNGQTWNGAGTFTLRAEDDATLTGNFTSSAPLDPTGSATGAPYTLNITGGTKRFNRASGSCTLDNHLRQIQFGVQEQSGSFSCDLSLMP
jgi:hypothetical protein